jgi:hypothetical protein
MYVKQIKAMAYKLYLKLFGRFVDFYCSIAALLVPIKRFEHADIEGKKKNCQNLNLECKFLDQ